jgi:16S rRNA (cytosine967-C5)-methyltransferase
MKTNPRAIATKVLLQVIDEGRSLTSALANADLQHTQANLVKELCFGVCRWYDRLTMLANALLGKPPRAKDLDVYLLILVGLYQILYLRVPEHAAVTETVEATRVLKKPWAAKLINGVLRTFLRQKETLIAKADSSLVGRYAHPKWMIDIVLAAWPVEGEAVLSANNQHPPLCLRVNKLQTTQEAYLKRLRDAGIGAAAMTDAPWALVLDKPQDVSQLPGFAQGQFSVQDSAAQFAASLLLLAPGQRVLDACAAPGGKTTHILETEPNLGALVAIDKEAERVARIKDNVQRLKLASPVQYHVADARETNKWWDGEYFDRILLDAPCSGTGVIRRHPDIKLLREPEDIAQLGLQQQALLEALWALLKPGGILLYATCSIFPDENEVVIQQFLATHTDAEDQPISATWGVVRQYGRQILTGQENRDGFYYARLVKLL